MDVVAEHASMDVDSAFGMTQHVARSPGDDQSRETVTTLMSLGLVLRNFRFADAAVGRANCATDWDTDEEKMEVKRRVGVEEHGRTFDRGHEERDENDMNSAKLDENRVRFLVMCRVPEQRLDSSAKTQ